MYDELKQNYKSIHKQTRIFDILTKQTRKMTQRRTAYGKNRRANKKIFKNKENFADLFNATIFQGEQVIKTDKLIEISTGDIHIDNVSLEKENISDNIQEETEELEITKKRRYYLF